MNKFTKLLSVFVIAGAVGAGVAGLTGCGGEQPHTHSATKHEAVAATCTQAGTKKYYTCDGSDCEGKYFEDEACTTEITDITVPATGHTEKYTDNGDGTHGITCEKGDLTETTAPHADEDHNGKCDACEADVDGVYVAEVPATCTVEGTAAHYINGDGSDGKYYSDCNLKNEVTAESLVIEKLPHTYIEYTTDKTYAKHSSSCDECGTKVTEDCVDTDNDGKCDVCGGDVSFLANAFAPAAYANIDNGIELVIAEDGTVSYVPGSGSSAKSGTLTKVNAYTATFSYEFRGQNIEKTVIMTKGGLTIDNYVLEVMPEEIVTSPADFCGVFAGELVMPKDSEGNVKKITEFGITADGYIVYTQVTTDKDGKVTSSLTNILNGVDNSVMYNDFTVAGYHFVALEVDANEMVTTIELSYEDATAIFTYKDGYTGEGFEIPTLSVEDYTVYKDTEGTNTLLISNYSTSPMYGVIFNEKDVKVISGNATDGYVGYMYYYDSEAGENVEKNVILKFNADSSAVEIFEVDGTTLIASLALSQVNYPTVVADGTTVNNNAVVDPFNNGYAYYKVDKTGWYKITAGDNDLTIYTEVNFAGHTLTTWGATVYNIGSGKSKAIQLTAGQYIAVSASSATNGFTATYSETEPEPEYASFTGGKYEIASFDGTETYYIKGTVNTAGKYYVTAVSDLRADEPENRVGLVFEINGVEYGSCFNSSYQWVLKDAGSVYSETLAAGAEVKVKLTAGYTYLTGKVTVYFETEEEYNARLNASAGEEFTGFTADQLGSYVYKSNLGATVTITLNADNSLTYTVTNNGADIVAETTFVSLKDGTYVFQSADTSIISFTLGNNSITVLGSNLYLGGAFGTYTATKGTSGGEIDDGGLKVGDNTIEVTDGWNGTNYTFKATEAGTYVLTFDATGDVGYDPGQGYTAFATGDTIKLSAGEEFTFICFMKDYGKTGSFTLTITKEGTSGGEIDDGGLKVGDNTIKVTDGWNGTNYTFKAPEAGTYVLTFDATGDVGYNPGQGYTAFATGDTIKLSAGEEFTFICFMKDYGKTGSFTLTITKEGTSSGTETPTTPVAVVGENTVQAGMAGYVEVTFSVPGTYTLTYDSNADNVMAIFVGTSMVANGGKFTVTDSVTIQVYANNNSAVSKFTITEAQASGGDEGSATTFEGFTAEQQGTYKYTGVTTQTFVIGETTITTEYWGSPIVLSFVSYKDGEYTMTGSDVEGTYSFAFKFDESGNMLITADQMNGLKGATAVKQA